MSRQVIDRPEWSSFVDSFSRRHEGWLVSVAVEQGTSPRGYLVRDLPLRGVVAEMTDHNGSLMVFTGDTAPHTAHFIERPAAMTVDENEEGAEVELAIVDASGARTIVEFRSPMRPELVDGLAR
jgi:hypothetical protein